MSDPKNPPTVFAALFGLLALSNLLKPLQLIGNETGFVLLGERLTGTANAIAGPIAGVYLLAYALGLRGLRRWALPMGWIYVAYVATNLVLFSLRTPTPPGPGYKVFGLVYAAVALGISGAAAMTLTRRRAELR